MLLLTVALENALQTAALLSKAPLIPDECHLQQWGGSWTTQSFWNMLGIPLVHMILFSCHELSTLGIIKWSCLQPFRHSAYHRPFNQGPRIYLSLSKAVVKTDSDHLQTHLSLIIQTKKSLVSQIKTVPDVAYTQVSDTHREAKDNMEIIELLTCTISPMQKNTYAEGDFKQLLATLFVIKWNVHGKA